MLNYTVKRDGLPPIVFIGEQISQGSTRSNSGSGQNRWTEVRIYRSIGGTYIACVARMTQWQGESDRLVATAKPTPEEIIQWLKSDAGSDTLGEASQEAVEEAVKADAKFAAAWVEKVD